MGLGAWESRTSVSAASGDSHPCVLGYASGGWQQMGHQAGGGGGGEEIRPITGQHKAMEPHTNGHFQDREMDPEVSKVSKCHYNYGKEVDPELGT